MTHGITLSKSYRYTILRTRHSGCETLLKCLTVHWKTSNAAGISRPWLRLSRSRYVLVVLPLFFTFKSVWNLARMDGTYSIKRKSNAGGNKALYALLYYHYMPGWGIRGRTYAQLLTFEISELLRGLIACKIKNNLIPTGNRLRIPNFLSRQVVPRRRFFDLSPRTQGTLRSSPNAGLSSGYQLKSSSLLHIFASRSTADEDIRIFENYCTYCQAWCPIYRLTPNQVNSTVARALCITNWWLRISPSVESHLRSGLMSLYKTQKLTPSTFRSWILSLKNHHTTNHLSSLTYKSYR